MAILEIISSILIIVAYFFNPKLKEKKEKEKTLAMFRDLENKLAQALLDKDMYLVDKIRYWLKEMRDKHDYLRG